MVDNASDLINTFGQPEENSAVKYSDPQLAMKKYGANAFINYSPSDKVIFNIAAGLEDSRVQKVYVENRASVLSTANSQTKYINLKASIKELTVQVSYPDGIQESAVGYTGQKWHFNIIDALVEYNFTIKNLSIEPGINYRREMAKEELITWIPRYCLMPKYLIHL